MLPEILRVCLSLVEENIKLSIFFFYFLFFLSFRGGWGAEECLTGYPVQVFRILKVFLNLKFFRSHANINKKKKKIGI
jgi:hypothetical protein